MSSTPSGPLPCSPLNFNHNLLKQGTGTADHLTLLRLFLVLAFGKPTIFFFSSKKGEIPQVSLPFDLFYGEH